MPGGSRIKRLCEKQLINRGDIPAWVPEALQLEIACGSFSYGVSSDSSDFDVVGLAIPDKAQLFPSIHGFIEGFDDRKPFEQWQKHHINAPDELGGRGRVYDFTVYNITKFFKLLMKGSPQLIDAIFVPQRCILYTTPIGIMIREARKSFLHKGLWHSYKGYGFAQLNRLQNKTPKEGSARYSDIQEHGLSTKEAYHVVRLMNEIEQILTEGDLDLEINREQLKTIRRGEWSMDRIVDYFNTKEKSLEKAYTESKLPWGPDETVIRNLLVNCLEQYFGSLGAVGVRKQTDIDSLLREMRGVIEKYE